MKYAIKTKVGGHEATDQRTPRQRCRQRKPSSGSPMETENLLSKSTSQRVTCWTRLRDNRASKSSAAWFGGETAPPGHPLPGQNSASAPGNSTSLQTNYCINFFWLLRMKAPSRRWIYQERNLHRIKRKPPNPYQLRSSFIRSRARGRRRSHPSRTRWTDSQALPCNWRVSVFDLMLEDKGN